MFNSVCVTASLMPVTVIVLCHTLYLIFALPRTEYIIRLFRSSKHKIYVLIKSIIFHFITYKWNSQHFTKHSKHKHLT